VLHGYHVYAGHDWVRVANTDDTETNSGSHPVNITVTRTGGSDEAVA